MRVNIRPVPVLLAATLCLDVAVHVIASAHLISNDACTQQPPARKGEPEPPPSVPYTSMEINTNTFFFFFFCSSSFVISCWPGIQPSYTMGSTLCGLFSFFSLLFLLVIPFCTRTVLLYLPSTLAAHQVTVTESQRATGVVMHFAPRLRCIDTCSLALG